MRVLLYLRKSTEEHQAESIHTQRAGAEAFASARGWSVVSEIVDEGESRAEFKKRPGFSRLLARSTSKNRDFDIVLARDETRMGAGERLTVALDDMIAAGVRVFYYASGEEVTLERPEHRLMSSIRAIMAETERAKTAERTREALERKAQQGLNAGGKCYGYDNVRQTVDGRTFTEYRINAQEAAVIVDIATRFADGESVRAIARGLNDRGVPSPRAGARGTGSWSPNAVNQMVRRPRYLGVLEWGRKGAAYKGGTRVTFTREDSNVVVARREDLRIIPADLEQRLVTRLARLEALQEGKGQYRRGATPRYLLSGKELSRCGECGGPMNVVNTKSGPRIVKAYACLRHKDRGDSVCTNRLQRPVDEIDHDLTTWITGVALGERAVAAILQEVTNQLTMETVSDAPGRELLEAELKSLDKKIKNLSGFLEDSDEAPDEVIGLLTKHTKRRNVVKSELAAQVAIPKALAGKLDDIEASVRRHIENLRDAMKVSPEKARLVVRSIFPEPLTFTPQGKRFEVTGVTDASAYTFTATAALEQSVREVTGGETVTPETDCSRTVSDPNEI